MVVKAKGYNEIIEVHPSGDEGRLPLVLTLDLNKVIPTLLI